MARSGHPPHGLGCMGGGKDRATWLLLCGSGGDAGSVALEGYDVAVVELPAAAALDLAVHRDVALDDGLFARSAAVEEARELHELPEADALSADGDVVDRIRVRHAGMLADGGSAHPFSG